MIYLEFTYLSWTTGYSRVFRAQKAARKCMKAKLGGVRSNPEQIVIHRKGN